MNLNMPIYEIPANRRSLPIIEFIFIILACLYYSNYVFQSQYETQMMLGFVLYVLFCYYKEEKYRKTIVSFLLLLAVFSVLYYLLTDTSSIGVNVSNRAFKRLYSKFTQYLSMFIPVFMLYRTARVASKRQMIIIISLILINFLMLARTAIVATQLDSEVLHSFREDAVESSGLTVAAFYFVYVYTFIFLIGWICYSKSKEKKIKYASLFFSLFSLFFLFKAQFALSIVTSFFSLLYLYITTTHNNRKIITVLVVIVVLLLSPLLLRGLISIVPEGFLSERLKEIYDMITGENTTSESDGQGRLDLYWMCIKAFFNSPLIGNRTLPEDGHSTFLTVPADIGIFGAIFLYVLFKKAYSIISGLLGSKNIYFKPLMLQIVLMGFTNPIHSSPSIYMTLFFMCPLLIILIIKEYRPIDYFGMQRFGAPILR